MKKKEKNKKQNKNKQKNKDLEEYEHRENSKSSKISKDMPEEINYKMKQRKNLKKSGQGT